MESPSREAKGCARTIPVLGWETQSATQVFTTASFLDFFFLTVLPHRPRRWGRSVAPSSTRRDLTSLATIAYGSSEI